MKYLFLLLALFLFACGKEETKPKSHTVSDEISFPIYQKASTYLDLAPTVQDADGFIDWSHCDSLLFSGLYGAAGLPINIETARDASGKWHRRSLNQPECYSTGGSQSTISRDMFLGLLWKIWAAKRLDLAEDLFNYGESHQWVMGDGDISRIYFTPGLQATLAEMIYRLGGSNKVVYRSIPQVYAENTGFAAHLDMLLVLLRADMTKGMEAGALKLVKYNYSRESQNPFYSYVYHRYTDGDQNSTFNLLANERLFPSDRLPTSHDRCEGWLNQRDAGEDWQPCQLDSEPKVHSGGDLVFVVYLLRKG